MEGRASLLPDVRERGGADHVTQDPPPPMNHVASLSESVALCGAVGPIEDAFLGCEDDVCCVVCAELWAALTYSEQVALSRYWGGGIS